MQCPSKVHRQIWYGVRVRSPGTVVNVPQEHSDDSRHSHGAQVNIAKAARFPTDWQNYVLNTVPSHVPGCACLPDSVDHVDSRAQASTEGTLVRRVFSFSLLYIFCRVDVVVFAPLHSMCYIRIGRTITSEQYSHPRCIC